DPAGPPGFLWWDGQAWSAHTAPPAAAGQPVATPAPSAASYGTPPGYATGIAPATGWRVNRFALITLAVFAVYLFLAFTTGFVVLGIFPLLMSFRSKRA